MPFYFLTNGAISGEIFILAIEKEIDLKLRILLLFILCALFGPKQLQAQHQLDVTVTLDAEAKTVQVTQKLTFHNQTTDALSDLVLNDWNNAYSDRETPLGKRFSDEFVRSFHLATEKEKGRTFDLSITDETGLPLVWQRPKGQPDLVEVQLPQPLLPGQRIQLMLSYQLKIPDDRFTRYGYDNNGNFMLKNWLLTPSRYENHAFLKYSNLNIDDIANALFDVQLKLTLPTGYQASTDLKVLQTDGETYLFSGQKLFDIPLYIEKKSSFTSYKNSTIEVISNLQENKVEDLQKAIVIDKVVNFVTENLGKNQLEKISVSQSDYDKNPFYGLNQLPSFLSPFPNEFIYELKFLKTYLNNYLKNSLQVDPRKDNWIFDAIQVYYMMKYIDEFYPQAKMMGNIYRYKLFRGYNLVSLDFNGQYSYFYMLMARKNLDQPLGDPKSTLIKFNEKIASKYRAGLSFKYLSTYIGKENLEQSVAEFVLYAYENEADALKLATILSSHTEKNTDWFFDVLVNSRQLIDYKFGKVTKDDNSISFRLKDKTNAKVPIPIYGLQKKEVVFTQWIDPLKADSTYTLLRNGADRLVINYKNEVPEYNRRNNSRPLNRFSLFNKPVKFIFLKDLEEPFYNQVIYVPTLQYNLYDGFIAGMRFHNKTILDKPFTFDVTPSYSTRSNNLTGTFALAVNQMNRDRSLYAVKYGVGGDFFHYAPDAYYSRINPYIVFRIRESDYRDNKKQIIQFRQVYVDREKSNFVTNTYVGSYSVFNARFASTRTEITKHLGYGGEVQLASKFGKVTGEISFRRLFDDNRQVSLRLYAGAFISNSTNSKYFDFALDRPTDYLFDYNYLGRSENSGLFSQQYILAEGGFKSKLPNPSANQWIATVNGSFNVWNWIEVYGDVGFLKSKTTKQRFVYDSGIRLNLVTDYFELYFPVYSNNGWEITQSQYAEKIRFIAAFSPNTLISLFTRKWF